MGVDALIIQDLGLLESNLPPIPLFASTQASLFDPAYCQFLESCGFTRLILERALSIPEIKAIRAQTTLELEAFIHGAICVCISGQCFLSLDGGGRSANRGACAQPCRKGYDLFDENHKLLGKGHYLSIKDLDLSSQLAQLLEAGITSFKIEGRMKNVSYVKNITAFYRQKIDTFIEKGSYAKTSSGTCSFDFTPDPDRTFHRPYTSYRISTNPIDEGRKMNDEILVKSSALRPSSLIEPRTPKTIGQELGKVTRFTQDWFELDAAFSIHPGDGLCFFSPDNELLGTQINKVDGQRLYPQTTHYLKVGQTVYRNFDREFEKTLEMSKTSRKIQVKLTLSNFQESWKLALCDEDNLEVSLILPPDEEARNADQAKENILKQFRKSADYPFLCEEIIVQAATLPFLPIAQLNSIRRELFEKLAQTRLAAHSRAVRMDHDATVKLPTLQLTLETSIHNEKAKQFYHKHGIRDTHDSLEKAGTTPETRLMLTRHCLRREFSACPKDNPSITKAERWTLSDPMTGRAYVLCFNCAQCYMEIYSQL